MLLDDILRSNEAFLQGRPVGGRLPSPIAMLTCVDARLNDFLGPALGIAREDIILVRNAGNVVMEGNGDPLRSLAMMIYLKGATEIVVLGHTDCRMSQFEANGFLDALSAWDVQRQQLGPVDLRRWAGAFHDPRQNVKRSVEMIEQCPFIPKRLPVHGILIDIGTGRIEILVEGGKAVERRTAPGAKKAAGASATVLTPPAVPDMPNAAGAVTAAHGKASAPQAAPPPVPPVGPPSSLRVSPPTAAAPAKIPIPAAAAKPATAPARPIPKDLLDSLRILRQAYAEMKTSKEHREEAERIRARVANGENLHEALDWIDRNARHYSAERPDVVAALQIVRKHVEGSSVGGHLQKLLNQIL
jgi:carbonic anhydrase